MVRVFMLSHLPLFSQGVETLLRREGVEIVGTDNEIESALAKVKSLCPDVVILDCTFGPAELPSIAGRILIAHKNTMVIAMNPEDNTVSVFREEQKTIHKIQDLLRAISNGTGHPPPSPAPPAMELKPRP